MRTFILDRKIKLLKKTITKNSNGTPVASYVFDRYLKAGLLKNFNDQNFDQTFVLRYNSQIDTSYVIEFDNIKYEIESIEEIQRRFWLRIRGKTIKENK